MKILIADDHPMTLFGTKSFVEKLGHKVVEICSNGIIAHNLILTHQPDIAILDINMPGMSGIEIAEKVQYHQIPTRIILHTIFNDRSVYKKALELGVYGYLLKNFSSDELEECLKAVAIKKSYFSSHLESQLQISSTNESAILNQFNITERKILELIAQQKSNRQIAEMLFLSDKTIEYHRKNIIEKLGLPHEKNVLLFWAIRNVEVKA
ncbi:MAG: response regulator transcription factor [Bacteroidia bacterium]|nr:response regulator transcription factor [Bacteroidia bacterium]